MGNTISYYLGRTNGSDNYYELLDDPFLPSTKEFIFKWGGKVLRKLTVIKKISENGRSTVYLTKDTTNESASDKHIVLKIIHSRHIDEIQKSLALQRQFKQKRAVIHEDYILRAKKSNEIDTLYITMEYYKYGSLAKYTETHHVPLPQSTIVGIIQDLFFTLALLHNQDPPLVHTNINPSNILIEKIDKQRIHVVLSSLDFMPQGTRRTTGKEAYMSPEREIGWYTTASDVWSAGATLFDLMTKKKKINVHVISEEEREEEEIRLRDALKSEKYDEKWVNLVLHMLKYEPEDRIKSIDVYKTVGKEKDLDHTLVSSTN